MDKLKEFCKLMHNECINIKTQMRRIDGEYTIRFCWETSELINLSAKKMGDGKVLKLWKN